MTIELGQWIDVLANLGVIAGFIFLGLEIRQNTIALRSEASFGFQAQVHSLYALVNTDPLTEIYVRGMSDPAGLNPVESAKLHTFLASLLASFQNLFIQVGEGATDETYAQGYWKLLRNMFEMPGMQAHWATRSFVLTDAFRQHVETTVMSLQVTGGSTVLSAKTCVAVSV